MRIPAIYFLLLLAAAVVLAFGLEFAAAYGDAMRSLVSPDDEETSNQKFDRRPLFLLAVVGGVAALAVAAAIIVGYSADPQRTSLLVAWPRDHHPASLLVAGVVFCLVAFVCGVKLRQPVLLVCLTLPGLVIMSLLFLPLDVRTNNLSEAVLFYFIIFAFQPGVWILLSIGIGQARLLRKPGGNFTPGGLVRLSLIFIAYAYGFITQ